jgi:nucleoside-diphosphate-sugar epimerase
MRILVTGATGFVGSALTRRLDSAGDQVVAAVRSAAKAPAGKHVITAVCGDLGGDTNWREALQGVDAVVHLAARVHQMNDQSADPLREFRRVNTDGALNLARQAAAAGVGRFVFVSSIKVNGEGTEPGRPFTANDTPQPGDPYGISKAEAEAGLRTLAAQTGMGVAIIRPVLVYGPGVRANFEALMRSVAKGRLLPFGAIDNRRSLVAVDNLVDLIVRCLTHPAAANQTFLVSDGEDVSTAELVRRIGTAFERPARLLAVPTGLLKLLLTLLGKGAAGHRLCSSLQVDLQKTRTLLDWQPPVGLDEGLRRAVAPLKTGASN